MDRETDVRIGKATYEVSRVFDGGRTLSELLRDLVVSRSRNRTV